VIRGRDARATSTTIRRCEVSTGSGSDRVNESTNIPNLSTALGIERRLIEDDFTFITFG
jgi:hypothetical protein